MDYPDEFNVLISNGLEFEHLIRDEYKTGKRDICEASEFKYMITLDGYASPFARGPQILYSESVPIVVESFHQPLY